VPFPRTKARIFWPHRLIGGFVAEMPHPKRLVVRTLTLALAVSSESDTGVGASGEAPSGNGLRR
jgi:hypothetical protein